jgi:hypothetical protein
MDKITKIKKLAEGGWALYSVDPKSKTEYQYGYVGAECEGLLPKGVPIENS